MRINLGILLCKLIYEQLDEMRFCFFCLHLDFAWSLKRSKSAHSFILLKSEYFVFQTRMWESYSFPFEGPPAARLHEPLKQIPIN